MSIFPYTQKSHYYYSMRKFYLPGRKKGYSRIFCPIDATTAPTQAYPRYIELFLKGLCSERYKDMR